jgi:hypothetical protein
MCGLPLAVRKGIAVEPLFYREVVKKIEAELPVFCPHAGKKIRPKVVVFQ